MKKNLAILLFSSILFSCSKDHSKLREQFIGTWNDYPNGFRNQISFYKDSVVMWDMSCFKSVGKWKIDKSKVKFHFPDGKHNPDRDEYFHWNYRLNSTKDSLFFSFEEDSYEHLIFKVENYWEHYLKSYKLEIVVPKADPFVSLRKIRSYKYPIIYIGWQNQKLTVKGEEYRKVLKTPGDYFYSLINSYAETTFDTIQPITIVADKNIPRKSLDSIKDIIRKLNFKNLYFFHVYKHEEKGNIYGKINPDCTENSSADWHWYGLYDWNGLDNENR